MKKWAKIAAAGMLAAAVAVPGEAGAAPARPITVYVDGVLLTTPQPPLMISGRTMLPMRAIFEALGAQILWNQTTKTVTAHRDGTTIVLQVGSKSATINGIRVDLDVPARIINNSTLVPVRFVSDALGNSIGWNQTTQVVTIQTPDGGLPWQPAPTPVPSQPVSPVASVSARATNQYGDGRDLEISFTRSSDDARIGHYRIYMVKAGKAGSFNKNTAVPLPNGRFTVVSSGTSGSVKLNAHTQDSDGETLRAGQAYRAFVMAVGPNGQTSLSPASGEVTLNAAPAVGAVGNLQARDINNYGDGRDLSVSFNRAGDEQRITSYRIMAVKTANAGAFDVNAALAVPSSSYTTVNKAGSALSAVLPAGARDTSGETIRNGVPYTIFVLSVSNSNGYRSALSSSASITLTGQIAVPAITQVTDVSNYGNGRDLQIAFNRVTDESPVYSYRIFAVKNGKAGNFGLNEATRVSSANYHEVSKTGSNQVLTLPAGMRDTDGATIRNNEAYRLFVMAVSSNNSLTGSSLSAPSQVITLTDDNVGAVSGLIVGDVADYNNGQDLMVAFNRSANESRLQQYRIMVVKASKASSFSLSQANNVSSANYTAVAKTGSSISRTLGERARDTDGELIRNGTAYRVFVLSVSSDNSPNVLSSPSESITLSGNYTAAAVSGVSAADNGDGSSLTVTFNRPSNESSISQYRVMLVKSGNADNFKLSQANTVRSDNYTVVNASGGSGQLSALLAAGTRDVNGEVMKEGVSYRVFVLSVANNGGNNALSSASSAVVLTSRTVAAASVSSAVWTDGGLEVRVNRPSNTSGIVYYYVYAIASGEPALTLEQASNNPGNAITLSASGSSTIVIGSPTVEAGKEYKIYVLSVADGTNATVNALSAPFTVTIPSPAPASAPAQVPAEAEGGTTAP